MGNTCFTQLRVWQAAHRIVLGIYRRTKSFPDDERFGLVAQLRRSSASIPANIAEGFGRRTPQDKARFYTIAEGSAQELKYHLILSRDLGYLEPDSRVPTELAEVCAMLRKLTDVTLAGNRDS